MSMGFGFRGRTLLHEQITTRCTSCLKIYDSEKTFCPSCGSKLLIEKIKVYANWGKKGITSYSYKLPNGITVNSKGTVTISLAKGITYTEKIE